jgi:hypothetical protein
MNNDEKKKKKLSLRSRLNESQKSLFALPFFQQKKHRMLAYHVINCGGESEIE